MEYYVCHFQRRFGAPLLQTCVSFDADSDESALRILKEASQEIFHRCSFEGEDFTIQGNVVYYDENIDGYEEGRGIGFFTHEQLIEQFDLTTIASAKIRFQDWLDTFNHIGIHLTQVPPTCSMWGWKIIQ